MMDRHTESHQRACLDELRPLVGLKVKSLIKDKDGCFGLEFDGFDLWLMADPEGNGPGFPEVTKT